MGTSLGSSKGPAIGKRIEDRPMPKGQVNPDDPIIIKKYANRRLYNTAVAEFVTLDDLYTMIKEGRQFVVHDAKSDTDITTSILAQILAEEEGRGNNLLPLNYLRQLLSFYNEGVGQYLSTYLDQSMENFASNQQQIMKQMQDMFSGAGALQQINKINRRNMEIFQKSLSMFGASGSGSGSGNGAHSNGNGAAASEAARAHIKDLEEQVASLQQQLDKLSKDKEEPSKDA